jgi:hypothetical protein
MKKDLKFLLAFAATTIATHLVVEAIKTRRERLYRHAAGESDYERTHPKPHHCKGGCKHHGTPNNLYVPFQEYEGSSTYRGDGSSSDPNDCSGDQPDGGSSSVSPYSGSSSGSAGAYFDPHFEAYSPAP